MKLPSIKRLLKEDFPDQGWIDKLLQPLNLFMETVVTAFNKNITVDNLKASLTTFEYTNSPAATNQFSVGLGTSPKHVSIGNVVGKNGSTISGPVYLSWSYDHSTDQLTISTVYGLSTANGKYDITLMIYGG